MQYELQRVRREIDQLLSLHLAEWSQVIASDSCEDLSAFVSVAEDLSTARQALEAACVGRLRIAGDSPEDSPEGDGFDDDDGADAESDRIRRRVTTVETEEVETESSGGKRHGGKSKR